MPARRGDDDHAAAAALDHRRQEGAGEHDDRLAVDPHHLGVAALGSIVDEAAVGAEAGVVDEQVDLDAELGDLGRERGGVGAEVAARST